MSYVIVHLQHAYHPVKMLYLDAARVISNELVLDEQNIPTALPTIVSIVNIVAAVNQQGYSLASDAERLTIARMINHYYLPNPSSLWSDQVLSIAVEPLEQEYGAIAHEMNGLCQAVLATTREIVDATKRQASGQVRVVQNRLIDSIIAAVRNAPAAWLAILKYVVKTFVNVLIETILQIPLHAIVSFALGVPVV